MSSFILDQKTKKQLFEIYNDVNKSIYGFGTIDTKIVAVDNMIIFSAHHNRVLCLKALEKDYSTLKESVDNAIMKVFKEQFRLQLEEKLKIYPKAVLRDYSAENLIAVTIIVL